MLSATKQQFKLYYHTTRLISKKLSSELSKKVPYSNPNVRLNDYRTHRCGELRKSDVGTAVTLSGWLEFKRGKRFLTLRDATGSCQILLNDDCELPRKESVVQVKGTVHLRPDGASNPDMSTGDVEVHSNSVRTLNECQHLPFPVNDFSTSREELRMKYRYLDIRSRVMQNNLRLRSEFLLNLRNFLCNKHRFVDVETPTLFRRTPGGAQEFVVPTRQVGKFYSLPQSPQQFKQLLMVGGIDRYMQIAKCYRDEQTKPERQPEFTQLDLELSFTNQEEIKSLIEEMLVEAWPAHLPSISAPFPRMTYKYAMENYGSDKPDTQFGSLVTDVTEAFKGMPLSQSEKSSKVKAFCVPQGCSSINPNQLKLIRKTVEKMYGTKVYTIEIAEDFTWRSALLQNDDCTKTLNRILQVRPGDLVLLCAHENWVAACEALGKSRTLISKAAKENAKPLHDDNLFNFLWVEDFPLFELEGGVIKSAHHPFTAALKEDEDLLYSEPLKVRGQHYDLVLNGSEVGGGSIRIHNSDVQKYVLEKVLREDSSQMTHLLEALDSGCPPHGGIALGLDRLLAIMCGASSIRDVIAFPKSSEGYDLMSGAPCKINDEELSLYNISIVKK